MVLRNTVYHLPLWSGRRWIEIHRDRPNHCLDRTPKGARTRLPGPVRHTFVRLMNLGDIYLKTFAAIIAISFIVSVVVASSLRLRHCSWRTVIIVALPLWLPIGFLSLNLGHQRLFVAWHKSQNVTLPRNGCLTYEPDFTRLYATYKMDRDEFETWVANHPWHLHAGDNGLLHHDGPRLGLREPELSFETESAPNGKQLRVYYKSRIMYVSYNAM